MKKILSVLLVSMFTFGSSAVFSHCGNADMHADKTKEEKKDEDKDA